MHLLRHKPAGRFSPVCLFRPASVVIIGAGSDVGGLALTNMREGGFDGDLAVADTPDAIAALPRAADLAVVATPLSADLLGALARKGTFAVVALCSADSPVDRGPVRVLGPRSFGIAVPSIGLNASLAHLPVPAGRIGLVSQSAALCRAVLDWARPNGIGFSHIVGIGENIDIGFGLVLDWLSRDTGTGAILLDIRRLKNARVFLSAARAASRLRPVVAIRPGMRLADPAGARELAFEAALRRAGVLCVNTLDELLTAAETLARTRPVRSENLAVVANAISASRMAADAVLRAGLPLAATHETDSHGLAGLAVSAAAAPSVGGVLVAHMPTGANDAETLNALTACRSSLPAPMLVCAMGETTGAAHRHRLIDAGVAAFATPEQAVRGFLHLVNDRRNRAAARELPSGTVLTVAPDRDTVRRVFADMRRASRLASMQDEALSVLCAYGIPVVPTRMVALPNDAIDAAQMLGFPAVVKLRQSERPGERGSGGLALDLHDPDEVAVACRLLAARRSRRTGVGDEGLLVQRQAARSREVRIRVTDDATFGPVISFGRGGTTADLLRDTAADLPPLNLSLAHGLIARTHVSATFARFRDMPAANTDAVAETLVRISQLVIDFPEIAELELNPLFVDADGVLAADGWLRLRAVGESGGRLAITPYPADLIEQWAPKHDGGRLIVRPIRPEDADQHGAFFSRLSPQDIRYRFFTAMRELSADQMARLTQIDYDREMAFVAVREASGETVGVARLVREDEHEGEFAVIVQADMKGKGVATCLMQRLIDWARTRGLREIVGQVLADNAPMLAFVRHLGFRLKRMPEEPDVVEARLALE
jgi:acetyltransferase